MQKRKKGRCITILFLIFTERKHMSSRLILLLVIILNFEFLVAQVNYPGRPIGRDHNLPVSFVKIERSQSEPASNESSDKYKTYRFAEVVRVDISPEKDGSWHQISSSLRVWILGICSPGCSSIGLTFSHYRLMPGVKVFVYPYHSSNYLGAFTFRNNGRYGILPVSPLPDDSIIIEMQVPSYAEIYGNLRLGMVSLGYPISRRYQYPTGDSTLSADCNVDVTCYLNRELQTQKHAVCKIIYENSGLCTGTLVNNTAWNGRPLILTSAHCIKNESAAQSAIFYFDYEREMCDGKIKPLKSVAGSHLLARNEEYDFALVEVQQKIPLDYNPVYAGWNVTGQPFAQSFTIHHPMGDVKKIAINEDPVMNGRIFNVPNDNYWVVPNYETGTTQAGSSGSSLFDSAFYIRGILSYGGESCKPFIYDYYIRLDQAWETSPDSTLQLACWLDPINRKNKVLSFYQPPNTYLPFAIPISHVDSVDILKNTGIAGGYIAGTNPYGIKALAEHFRINGSRYIYAVKIHVHRLYATSARSTLTLKIWSGRNQPDKLLYQQAILLFELAPEEYNLIRLDSMELVNESFFVGFEFNTQLSDTFSMYFAERPSLKENTAWARYDNGWYPLFSGTDYLYAALDMEVLGFNYYFNHKNRPGEFPFEDRVSVYPNPAQDQIQILFSATPTQPVTCRIYDLQGRLCATVNRKNSPQNFAVETSSLRQGIYILSVQCEWGIFNFRIMVNR